jgi:hypothetical protein
MGSGFLGIPDPWIWLAYLLCLAAAARCGIHAFRRSRGSDPEPTPADTAWAKHEKEAAEEE